MKYPWTTNNTAHKPAIAPTSAHANGAQIKGPCCVSICEAEAVSPVAGEK